MTDEQINAAIAEACGWKTKNNHWITPNGTSVYTIDLPDYCTDLNAMHEAEKGLRKHIKASDTDRIVGNRMHEYAELIGYAIDATARQRAEAFLRTLGKWEENAK